MYNIDPILIAVLGILFVGVLAIFFFKLQKANNEIKSESNKRFTAEEKNTRIPELEKTVTVKEELIAEFQNENTKLKTELSILVRIIKRLGLKKP